MDDLIYSAGTIVLVVIQLLFYIIIASALLSWVSPDPNNPIVKFIYTLTEPMYRPIRKVTSKFPGPLDWAPLVLLLFLQFLMILISRYLQHFK